MLARSFALKSFAAFRPLQVSPPCFTKKRGFDVPEQLFYITQGGRRVNDQAFDNVQALEKAIDAKIAQDFELSNRRKPGDDELRNLRTQYEYETVKVK